MKKSIAILILLPMLLVNCRKTENETPSCIKDLIRSFENSAFMCDTGATVDEYSFLGSQVYVFDPGNCGADMQALVYDSKGTMIGALGGIVGNTSVQGVQFSDNAVFVRTVWKN